MSFSDSRNVFQNSKKDWGEDMFKNTDKRDIIEGVVRKNWEPVACKEWKIEEYGSEKEDEYNFRIDKYPNTIIKIKSCTITIWRHGLKRGASG